MKNYICLNHGECSWADEKPPRVFSLPEGEENVCPNCEGDNIREIVPPSPPIGKFIKIAGALILVAAIAWLIWFQSQTPLALKAEMDCVTGLITLTLIGADEEPITFSADGLNRGPKDNIFKIPKNRRLGSTFTFHAEQSGETTTTKYTTDCQSGPLRGAGPSGGTNSPRPPVQPNITWSRVNGSEFCLDDCVVEYTEQDNLGHTRVRKVSNYAKCCPAEN